MAPARANGMAGNVNMICAQRPTYVCVWGAPLVVVAVVVVVVGVAPPLLVCGGNNGDPSQLPLGRGAT